MQTMCKFVLANRFFITSGCMISRVEHVSGASHQNSSFFLPFPLRPSKKVVLNSCASTLYPLLWIFVAATQKLPTES